MPANVVLFKTEQAALIIWGKRKRPPVILFLFFFRLLAPELHIPAICKLLCCLDCFLNGRALNVLCA